MNASTPCDPALFNLASFVTNSAEILTIKKEMTPAKVSALSSLLLSGAEIERLALQVDLPKGSADELGEAIKCFSRISVLSLGHMWRIEESCPELTLLTAVSASAALDELSMERLYIDDKCLTQFRNSFGKSPALRSLTIKKCRFATLPLIAWISQLQALESLHILEVKLNYSGIGKLIAALMDLPAITELEIYDVEIGERNCKQIGSLVALGRIRKLSLCHDHLKDKGISNIVDAIRASGRRRCELRELHLLRDYFGPIGVQKVAELVVLSPNLRLLNLRANHIVKTAIETLQKCANSLRELDINDCKLGPHEVVLLLAPPACSALTTLRINDNKTENLGACAVARFLLLSVGRTLTELHMNSNGITDTGALELAKGLAEAYALRSISIKGNKFGPRGASAILEALATASTVPMDMIDFEGCGIGDDGAEAVGKLVMHRGCKRILLYRNEIHCKGAKAIADSIHPSVCMIKELNLYKNPIADEGVEYLLDKVIQQNKFICEFCIDLSNIGVKGPTTFMGVAGAQGSLSMQAFGEIGKNMKAKDVMDEVRMVGNNLEFEGGAIMVNSTLF